MSGELHKNDTPLYLRPSLIVSVLIAFFCFITAAQSQVSSNNVSRNTDWSVFVEKNPKECWAVTSPKMAKASFNGKVVAIRRGRILLFTFFRPGEGVTGQTSFTAGYPFAKNSLVSLRVGSQIFKLETNGEWAWPTSKAMDTKVLAALQRGRSATLVGNPREELLQKTRFGAVRRMRTRIRLLVQPEPMHSIVGATVGATQ